MSFSVAATAMLENTSCIFYAMWILNDKTTANATVISDLSNVEYLNTKYDDKLY